MTNKIIENIEVAKKFFTQKRISKKMECIRRDGYKLEKEGIVIIPKISWISQGALSRTLYINN